MSQVRVSFSDTPAFLVYEEELTSWFTDILGYSIFNVISGDRLVSDVEDRLSRHIQEYIKPERIRMTLKHLFEIFKSRVAGSKTAGFFAIIGGLQQHDAQDRFTSGLRGTRQRFLILCAFAHQMHSEPLAETLVGFLSNSIFGIVEEEDPYLLRSWGLGLHELRGLVSGPVLAQLLSLLTNVGYGPGHGSKDGWPGAQLSDPWTMAMMMRNLMEARHNPFTDNYRGRRLAEPEATGWGHRARSLPVTRRRPRSPDWQVRRLRLPHSGWVSPVVSPATYPMSEYFDELKAVGWEQNVQAIEVDDLQRRVRLLELGA